MSDTNQDTASQLQENVDAGEYTPFDDNAQSDTQSAVDKTIATNSTTTTATMTDGDSNIVSIPPSPALALPDGRIIDSKNTLQSFSSPPTTSLNPTTVPATGSNTSMVFNKFTLSDGRIIDGKNTLQSFHAPSTRAASASTEYGSPQPISSITGIPLSIDMNQTYLPNVVRESNSNTGDETIHAHAVAVYSVLVAENDVLESQQQLPPTPTHSRYLSKKNVKCGLGIAILIILFSAATGIGVYCGAK